MTGYDEMSQVLMDRDSFAHAPSFTNDYVLSEDASIFEKILTSSIASVDGQGLARLRRTAIKALSAKGVTRYAEHVRSEAEALLAEAAATTAAHGQVDWISQVAKRFPIRVLGHVLGFEPEQFDRLGDLMDQAIKFVDPTISVDELEAVVAAFETVAHMIEDVVAGISVPEGTYDDHQLSLIEHLVDSRNKGSLTHYELVALVMAMLFADGTQSLLGIGFMGLIETGEFRKIQKDPALVPNAAEELLRWTAVSTGAVRYAKVDIEVGDRLISAGDSLVMPVGSANRDARHFDDAAIIDIERENASHHITFGKGARYCLGANLARQEVVTLLGTAAELYDIEIVGEPVWNFGHPVMRYLTGLPVRVTELS